MPLLGLLLLAVLAGTAKQRLELLASELDRSWPDAAGPLREGMDDTLTLMRLIRVTERMAVVVSLNAFATAPLAAFAFGRRHALEGHPAPDGPRRPA